MFPAGDSSRAKVSAMDEYIGAPQDLSHFIVVFLMFTGVLATKSV